MNFHNWIFTNDKKKTKQQKTDALTFFVHFLDKRGFFFVLIVDF